VRLRLVERPTGNRLCEIFCVLILAENGLRVNAKNGATRRFEQRPDVAAIFAVVDCDELLPDGAIADFLHRAFEDYGFVRFFRANGAAGVVSEVSCLARAKSGAEPEGVLPPNAPDKHEVGAPIGPRCSDPVVVRIFQAFEGPGPGFEAGGSVAGLVQRIWPERMTRFWCKHGVPCRESGREDILASEP